MCVLCLYVCVCVCVCVLEPSFKENFFWHSTIWVEIDFVYLNHCQFLGLKSGHSHTLLYFIGKKNKGKHIQCRNNIWEKLFLFLLQDGWTVRIINLFVFWITSSEEMAMRKPRLSRCDRLEVTAGHWKVREEVGCKDVSSSTKSYWRIVELCL